MKNAVIRCKPWRGKTKPKKILAIRFQALGDLMITLPYLQSLKEQTSAQIHLLTRREVAEIPENLTLFEKVFSIGGGRNAKIQFLLSLMIVPYLLWQRYEVVIDLQNHRISKIIRALLRAKAWSEFDRSSRILAGERTRLTIDALQVSQTFISTRHKLKKEPPVENKLKAKGWNRENALIILNPAGAFASRQWPLENYISFARLWKERYPLSQFLILGLDSLKFKANLIRNELRDELIDLTGITSLIEVFAIIKLSSLMVTEDSGLMHMSWVQGVPTVALFGSTPSYWSSPLGIWSRCFSSSDLPCGDCFSEACKFGDVHCLTRLSPEKIVDEAEGLLKSIRQ
jgi:ADP-heptose:LPS heptosyltransferase